MGERIEARKWRHVVTLAAEIRRPREYIDRISKDSGLSLGDLALIVGVHPDSMSRWRSGRAHIGRSSARALRLIRAILDGRDFDGATNVGDWLQIELGR